MQAAWLVQAQLLRQRSASHLAKRHELEAGSNRGFQLPMHNWKLICRITITNNKECTTAVLTDNMDGSRCLINTALDTITILFMLCIGHPDCFGNHYKSISDNVDFVVHVTCQYLLEELVQDHRGSQPRSEKRRRQVPLPQSLGKHFPNQSLHRCGQVQLEGYLLADVCCYHG